MAGGKRTVDWLVCYLCLGASLQIVVRPTLGPTVGRHHTSCLSSQTHSLGWPSAFGYGTPTPGGKRAGHTLLPLWVPLS